MIFTEESPRLAFDRMRQLVWGENREKVMLDGTPHTHKLDDSALEDPALIANAPPSPSALAAEAMVAMTAAWMTPFAALQETATQMARVRTLSTRWARSLAQCRTPAQVIETQAEFGRQAMALGFASAFGVMERSSLVARRAVAPVNFAERNKDAA